MDRKTQKLLTAFEEKARALGFDGVKIAAADSIPEAGERLRHFLDKGYEGSMGWMAETADRRSSPQALWPEVRSVIMLAMNYGPGSAPHEHPLAHLADKTTGGISVYARHRDYHDVIKGRLKELASFLVSRSGGDVKVFVDTAPVMEKPLGEAAGLGWQGKHTNLVSRDLGSWFSSARSSPHWICRRAVRNAIIAAPAAPASTVARRTHFPRPTSSMRGAAFPTSPSNTPAPFRTRFAKPSATEFTAVTIAWLPAPGTSLPKLPGRQS